MIDRYNNRRIVQNMLDLYENIFRNKNIKMINQYNTPSFRYPNFVEMNKITIYNHIWKVGDKYYKLAYEHYGDSKDWWIIAMFNQKPTESHVNVGDIIMIPKPLNIVINYLNS